jgi:hypothetical protein
LDAVPYKNPHHLYSTWAHLLSRSKHGGQPVCSEWRSFKQFLSDVGDKPNGYVLIRPRRSEPFSATNSKWVPESERHSAREDNVPGISHPLYTVWRSMIDRCTNKKSEAWPDYGGRGISICERWLASFPAFVSDMGPRPDGYQIERENNDGNYNPSNCKWATRKEQQRNRRNTRRVIIEGRQYLIADLAERSGLKWDTIRDRVRAGLPLDKVLSSERFVFTAGLALGGKASGAKKLALTHCKNGHEFTQENTRITPEGWRNCRRCHADRQLYRNTKKRIAQQESL